MATSAACIFIGGNQPHQDVTCHGQAIPSESELNDPANWIDPAAPAFDRIGNTIEDQIALEANEAALDSDLDMSVSAELNLRHLVTETIKCRKLMHTKSSPGVMTKTDLDDIKTAYRQSNSSDTATAFLPTFRQLKMYPDMVYWTSCTRLSMDIDLRIAMEWMLDSIYEWNQKLNLEFGEKVNEIATRMCKEITADECRTRTGHYIVVSDFPSTCDQFRAAGEDFFYFSHTETPEDWYKQMCICYPQDFSIGRSQFNFDNLPLDVLGMIAHYSWQLGMSQTELHRSHLNQSQYYQVTRTTVINKLILTDVMWNQMTFNSIPPMTPEVN